MNELMMPYVKFIQFSRFKIGFTVLFIVHIENKSSSVRSKSEKEDKSVSAGESGLGGASVLSPDDLVGTSLGPDDGDSKSGESKPVTPTEISSLLPDNGETKGEHRLARQPAR